MQLVEETIHHLFASLGYVWFSSYELYVTMKYCLMYRSDVHYIRGMMFFDEI